MRRFGVILLMMILPWAATAGGESSGNLVVFHAGSLAAPFKRIAADFHKLHPEVEIRLEAAGSRECARKVRDLNRPCDVLASADYAVIDQLLIPEYADWNIRFAANEMVLAYRAASRRSAELTSETWFEILTDPKVAFGRSAPDSDPCGYRAVFTIQLAEKHYRKPGLTDVLLKKNVNFIRPKETDLLALLETGTIDYIFLYRSVAEQHGLPYLILPDFINLKKAELAEHYRKARMELSGKKPGEKILQTGEPMVYGVTIPRNAPNRGAAVAFVRYLLETEGGMAVLEELGQPSVVPSFCPAWDKLPPELRLFARREP